MHTCMHVICGMRGIPFLKGYVIYVTYKTITKLIIRTPVNTYRPGSNVPFILGLYPMLTYNNEHNEKR